MKCIMPQTIREQIKNYIKNRIDISDLIRDYSIKGENLSSSIIKTIDRADEDISGCDMSNSIIGEEGKILNFNRTRAIGCNMRGAKFLGTVWARQADFRNSSLKDTFIPYIDYKYADLRGVDFCNTVFTIGTTNSLGAIFDDKFFKDLAKYWGIEITVKKING